MGHPRPDHRHRDGRPQARGSACAYQPDCAMPDLEGLVTGWLHANAERAGLPEGVPAEAFKLVTVPF